MSATQDKAIEALRDVIVVLGMPRSGTTWLYENLKQHPDICASDYKEINRYLRDITDLEYLEYFPDFSERSWSCAGKKMLDISPAYFFDLNAISSIAAKHRYIILIVRDPSEWIDSLAAHIGKYDRDVEKMVAEKKFSVPIDREHTLSFDYGAYRHDHHLAAIRSIVGENLLEINFSSLQQNPIATLKLIERYAGIQDYFTVENSLLETVNSRHARISPLYALLMRSGFLNNAIRMALRMVPRRAIHWLRRRFVYGR